jgi:tRNA(Arg) A34 adenosine deaminase TadA
MENNIQESDKTYLKRCLELAALSVKAGDEAFGSILVDKNGKIIAEARNKINEKNVLAHPEIELAQWAAEHLSEEERAATTMFTSGEHCPMCSAAHGLAGLGALVYLSSAKQLGEWKSENNQPEAKINFLPVEEIIKNVEVRGPGEGELLKEIKALHLQSWEVK